MEEDDEEEVRVALDENQEDGNGNHDRIDNKRRMKTPASNLLQARKRMRVLVEGASTVRKRALPSATTTSPQSLLRKLQQTSPVRKLEFQNDLTERILEVEAALNSARDVATYARVEARARELLAKADTASARVFAGRLQTALDMANTRIRNYQLAETCKAKGKEFYDARNYADAERAYSESARLDSSRAVIFSNRAAALIMLGRYRDAVADCDRAAAIEPTYVRAYLRCARAHLSLGDVQNAMAKLAFVTNSQRLASFDSEIVKEAYDMTNQARAYSDLVTSGENALREEKCALALKNAHEALQIAPASVKAKCMEITALLMIQALGIVVQDASCGANRSVIDELKRLADTNGCQEIMNFGILLWTRALRPQAAQYFEISARASPNDVRAASYLKLSKEIDELGTQAHRLGKEGRYLEAIQLCDAMIAKDPNNAVQNGRVLFVRAGMNLYCRRFAECETDCTATLRLIPTYHKARIRRAQAMLELGKFQQAETEARCVFLEFAKVLQAPSKKELEAVLKAVDAEKKKKEAAQNPKPVQPPRSSYFTQGGDRPMPPPPPSSSSNFYNNYNKTAPFPPPMFKVNPNKPATHYSVLGVSRDANIEDIRTAYKKAARKWHPDKNPGPDATAKFQRIAEAYDVVKSPGKRHTYDRTLIFV